MPDLPNLVVCKGAMASDGNVTRNYCCAREFCHAEWHGSRSVLTVACMQQYTLGLLAGLCALALLPQLTPAAAIAQVATAPTTVAAVPTSGALANGALANVATPEVAPQTTKRYFIEFRARAAQSYGHTFSIFGRINAQGKIVTSEVAGLHPFTESAIPWMIGHLVVVPSEIGASDGDTEDQYVLARFRIVLSEAEYKKVTKFVKQLQDKSPLWHAVLYNCNAFVGDIARFMGLETPTSTLSMPQEYIDTLRDLNIKRTNLAGVIGTPVEVQDAAVLRAAALRAIERQNERQKKSATSSKSSSQ